jgi:hypothetical protein
MAAPALGPTFTARELMNIDFPPVKYIVDRLITEGLTVLASRPKLGKSWMAFFMADAIARGRFFFDAKCEDGDVLYLALEDTPRRLRARYAKLVQSGEPAERLHLRTHLPRWSAGGRDEVERWIANAPNPRLIIVDTWQKIRSPKLTNELDYEADYRQVGELKELADTHGVAVLVIHHTRKMMADDPIDAVSGSTGITGAADTILVLKAESGSVTLYGRGRDIEELELAIQFDRGSCQWHLLGEASDVRRSEERSKILSVLIDADEPLPPAEISRRTGMEPNNVDQLLLKMTRTREVTRIGRGKYGPPDSPDKNDKEIRSDLEGSDA